MGRSNENNTTSAGRCERCGTSFRRPKSFYKLCLECWRAARERELYEAGFAAGRASAASMSPAIDPALVTAAIRLCHPDKHPADRFDTANAITARLNALRDHLVRGAA